MPRRRRAAALALPHPFRGGARGARGNDFPARARRRATWPRGAWGRAGAGDCKTVSVSTQGIEQQRPRVGWLRGLGPRRGGGL